LATIKLQSIFGVCQEAPEPQEIAELAQKASPKIIWPIWEGWRPTWITPEMAGKSPKPRGIYGIFALRRKKG